MALFTLADLHLSFSVEKPMDVFGGRWKGYVGQIEAAWRERIAPGDTVVLPGDFSWGMTLGQALEDFRFLHSLPGRKILLKGNHDYWWNSVTKMRAFLADEGIDDIFFLQNDAYEANGAILCGSRGWICEDKMSTQDEKILRREAMRFELSLRAGEALRLQKGMPDAELIVFSHYPLITGSERENPILPVLEKYGVKRVYYGHLHNWEDKPLCDFQNGIRFTLVASDHCRFVPQLIET